MITGADQNANLTETERTADEESKVHRQYILSTYVVNVFFLLQIVVGAALTALGAAKGPSAAVTFLGALNTVVAGILTYLKGQGLPGRLEQYQHLLRTLREHIEEREREFGEPDCALDVDEVVQSIVQMYKEVRQTAEDNAPGNVLPPKGAIASLMKRTEAGNRVPTPEATGGTSLGDRLKEAERAVRQAGPAMKHGLEDIKAVKEKAEREFLSGQEKLQGMVAGTAMTETKQRAEKDLTSGQAKINDVAAEVMSAEPNERADKGLMSGQEKLERRIGDIGIDERGALK